MFKIQLKYYVSSLKQLSRADYKLGGNWFIVQQLRGVWVLVRHNYIATNLTFFNNKESL